jgi:hypothetical protein
LIIVTYGDYISVIASKAIAVWCIKAVGGTGTGAVGGGQSGYDCFRP